MPLHLRNANIMFLLFVCLFACLFACLFVLLLARLQLSPALREWELTGVQQVMLLMQLCLPLLCQGSRWLSCKGEYSEGLGFESPLDSTIFLKGCFLTLLAKNIIHECLATVAKEHQASECKLYLLCMVDLQFHNCHILLHWTTLSWAFTSTSVRDPSRKVNILKSPWLSARCRNVSPSCTQKRKICVGGHYVYMCICILMSWRCSMSE